MVKRIVAYIQLYFIMAMMTAAVSIAVAAIMSLLFGSEFGWSLLSSWFIINTTFFTWFMTKENVVIAFELKGHNNGKQIEEEE